MRSNFRIPSRRVRHYIQLAMAGAALGTVGIAIPSHADDVHVNNTDASGPGTLAQAITEGGHIVFDSPLTNGAQFTSALPSYTSSDFINFLMIDEDSGLNTFTVTQGLTADNDSLMGFGGNGTLNDYSITSDLTARGGGIILITNSYTVNGNLAADGYGNLNLLNSNQSRILVGASNVNGATVRTTNGGLVEVSDNSNITLSGDATADGIGSNGMSSEIDLADGSTLTANNLTATDGGYVHVYGATVTLSGDVLADGIASTGENSKVDIVDGSALTATNLKATNGGIIGVGAFDENNPMTSSATVALTGDVLADGVGSNGDSSEIDIVDGSALTATNFKSTNGGVIELGVHNPDDLTTYSSPATATLTDDVLANGVGNNGASSKIGVYNGSTLTAANLTATDGGYVDVYGATVTLSGDATADGIGNNGVRSEIEIAGGSTLNGNAVATNGGSLYIGDIVVNGGGGATITGNVTINAKSILRNRGFDFADSSTHLNTDGGTTSFNADSIFAPSVVLPLPSDNNNPPIDFANSLYVDNLVVSDTAKI